MSVLFARIIVRRVKIRNSFRPLSLHRHRLIAITTLLIIIIVFIFFQGLLGFYKGIVASYMGISETVIHFVIYEAVKSWLITHRSRVPTSVDDGAKTSRDFFEFMAAGACSKTVASCIAYPHGEYSRMSM